MNWINIALNAYDFLKGFIGGSQGSGDSLSRNAAIRAFQAAQEVVNDLADSVWWGIARDTDGAWQSSGVHVSTQRNLGSAQSSTNLAVKHIVQVVLPRSFKYLEGKIVSKHIGPLGSKIADLNGRVGARNSKNAATLNGWRNDVGDPLARNFSKLFGDWVGFQGWFGGSGRPSYLGQLSGKGWIGWFAYAWDNPDVFADRLLGRTLGDGRQFWSPVVRWLRDGSHQGGADDLIQTLIEGSPDRWRYIVAATETILAQDYP